MSITAPPNFVAFAKDVEPFVELPLALSGYPATEAGSEVFYLGKEIIPIGEEREHPDKGYPIHVPRERAEGWIRKFNLMLQRGHRVPAPPNHDDRDNDLGTWVEMSLGRNKRGGQSLFGVLKVVGQAMKEKALSKCVSIRTVKVLKDDLKHEYPDAVEHIAVTPFPALTGLSGWASIAASRGPAEEAFPVLDLTALQEPDMDLKELRKALGAADTLPDADVITQAAAKLGTIPAMETAKATAEAAQAVALTRATEAEQARDTATLALSRATPGKPTARELHYAGRTLTDARNKAVAAGYAPAACKAMEAKLLPSTVKPEELALNRSPEDGDGAVIAGMDLLTVAYDALAANPPTPKTGTATSAQVIDATRTVPDGTEADNAKPITPERKKELLALAGVHVAA